jgi:hypothetical protein
VTQQELAAKLQSGVVRGTDLIWKEGMADWLPLNQVPEFSGNAVSGAQPMPAPMYQPQSYGSSIQPKIVNYLWQSIVVTLLCCLPFGIVAIVYAAKVDGLVAAGDIVGAQAASKSAKLWVNLSAGSVLVIIAIYAVLAVIGVVAGGM